MGEHTVAGDLDMLILRSLLEGPSHGYGISERVRRTDTRVFEVGEGSLYPALYRLQQAGLVNSEQAPPGEIGSPRVYGLTQIGRQRALER